MKRFIFTLIILCFSGIIHAKNIDGGIFHSEKNVITYDFNRTDYAREWIIQPEICPDILRVYCERETLVTFHLGKKNLQSRLTRNSFFINYAWQSRINDGVRKANGNWIKEYEDYYLDKAYRTEDGDTIFIADSLRRWTMPTVILIGEFTFSAAEDFLVNLYETKNRPLFIGQETGGSTGSPLVIDNLPCDGRARLCTRRILYPYSHTPFVNKGVTPDIIVPTSFKSYSSGQDEVLEKAKTIVIKIKGM